MPASSLTSKALATLAAVSAMVSVSEALAQFGVGGAFGRSSTTTYPSATSIGAATFMSDPETRKLVVVTDEETAQYIANVVTNLDRRPPQVLIKVVFMEATYRKDLDIGVEGGISRSINGAAQGSASHAFGISSLGSLVNSNVNVFNQPISGFAPIPPGAGLYTVLANDYQATLRAIARAGKTEILSRPSILARNNQQATISLGKEVPIISGTRFDTLGNQYNTVTYRTVGIQLTVTPFITSDGMVEMIVTPTISDLADKSQWVTTSSGPSGTISSPVINSRSADTVVVVPNGQTVIIGGLMEKQNQRAESKIPLLGDIPLLGAAFRHRVDNNTKTELLIFLTPTIVDTPTELAAMSSAERSAASASQSAFSQSELESFLGNVPPVTNSPPAKAKPARKTRR
ncbi:MAG: type II secretion system protein GspD [Verrucomicrobiia bacterium]